MPRRFPLIPLLLLAVGPPALKAQVPPKTLGDVQLFDIASYRPFAVYAYPQSNVAGSIGVYDPTGSFIVGFTAPTLTSTLIWSLPSADGIGCLVSDGALHLSIAACGGGGGSGSPGGTTGSVQTNNGTGGFAGDTNLVWASQLLTVTGVAGSPALVTAGGAFIQSSGGFLSAVGGGGNWQGFNTSTDGALLRGLNIAPNAAANAGGYINMAPLGYANLPLPLPGLSALGNVVIWVSGTNPTVTPLTSVALNTNTYINAAGGFLTMNTPYNSVQAPSGGMLAKAFVGTSYIQSGHGVGDPTALVGNTIVPGTLYYNDTSSCEMVYNGSAFVCLSASGGGSVAGSNKQVQFNNTGAFGASSHFTWDNTAQLLTVTGIASTAGIAVATGFIQSDGGIIATSGTCLLSNCVQAPTGGMTALSFSATKYVQAGNSNGAPAATSGDAFHPGALYWDLGSHALQVYNESAAWVAVATGGATSPGGSNKQVQFNSTGSFGGSANMQYDSTLQLFSVTALDSAHAGIAVATGFIQSDNGFIATTGVATNYNSIQAPTGGMAARSFTAQKYVQVGSGSADPTVTSIDTFGPGTLYWNTVDPGLRVYNGSTFVPLGGGGSAVGGANTNVQYNNLGAFAGSSKFTFVLTPHPQVTITGDASSASLSIVNGYVQSDGGLAATAACTLYNCIQATTGGVLARSLAATVYTNVGNNTSGSNGISNTTSGGFTYGSMYYNVGLGAVLVCQSPSCSVGQLGGIGGGWAAMSTASGTGVTSLNALTGALSIVGTANQITVTPSGSSVTLSTPQNIATTSNVNFGTVLTTGAVASAAAGSAITFQNSNFNFQVNGNGVVSVAQGFTVTVNTAANSVQTTGGFTSLATGSSIAYKTNNGNFQVDGNGNISALGVFASTGASGGFNYTSGSPAFNSFQSTGGINIGSTGNANGQYFINSSAVISNTKAFVGTGGVNTAGGGTFASAVVANGGIATASASNSTIFIGAAGNFYGRTFTGGAPSCTGVADGWTGYNTTLHEIFICQGGTEYHSAAFTTP